MNTKNVYVGKTNQRQATKVSADANRKKALASMVAGGLLLALLATVHFTNVGAEDVWINLVEVALSTVSSACFFIAYRYSKARKKGDKSGRGEA